MYWLSRRRERRWTSPNPSASFGSLCSLGAKGLSDEWGAGLITLASAEHSEDEMREERDQPPPLHPAPLSHSRGSFDTERSEVEEETVVSGERVWRDCCDSLPIRSSLTPHYARHSSRSGWKERVAWRGMSGWGTVSPGNAQPFLILSS